MSNQNITGEVSSKKDKALHIGKPKWLKTQIPTGEKYFQIKSELKDRKLATVCQEGKCPNIGKCWNEETATIMILGDTCTRACRFCNIKTGNPDGWVDADEPRHIAESCHATGIKYIVLTMVDRDDLPDGGAQHVADVVRAIKDLTPEMKVELLAGDFNGNLEALRLILASGIDVYAHNVETIERLTPRVRDARASYSQSLTVLAAAKRIAEELGKKKNEFFTKSGLMLGLGETNEEIVAALADIAQQGVDFITMGQYMRPTKKHLSIKRWVTPDEFTEIGEEAKKLGFMSVASAPLVRSSYRAREFYQQALDKVQNN